MIVRCGHCQRRFDTVGECYEHVEETHEFIEQNQ